MQNYDRKDDLMKKIIFSTAIVSALMLGACGGEEDSQTEEKSTEVEEETNTTEPEQESEKETETTTSNWQEEITTLANNSDAASDKYYALEKFMMNYEATANEIEEFSSDIVNDYKSGSYLNELENHERMLTNIFKGYIVEKNADGALKDFAFDYFQNLKYTYRGVDAVDSESVKSNEAQMDKAYGDAYTCGDLNSAKVNADAGDGNSNDNDGDI